MSCTILLGIVVVLTGYGFSIAQELKRTVVNNVIEYVQYSPHAYIVVTYTDFPGYGRLGTNHLLYIKNNRAFLFDSPHDNSVADELYRWAHESLNAEITDVFVSHWHKDHSGGLDSLHKSGANSYSHVKTREFMVSAGLPPARNSFADSLVVDFEGTGILLAFPGAGHTRDNSVGWIGEEKILFSGSVIRALSDRNLGYRKDADIVAWPHTIANIRKQFGNAVLILPGHGDPGGTELLEHSLKLTEIPSGQSKGRR
jgi:metallo-beta-lactamase class B